MRIGINASFLRKPGTGIGQVTLSFLRTLTELPEYTKDHQWILYCEAEPSLSFVLPSNFQVIVFLPMWKRDDILRKIWWEHQVGKKAIKDGCEIFLSLYQSGVRMRGHSTHVMIVHDIIPNLFPLYRGNMRQAYYWNTVERGILSAHHLVAVSEHTKNDIVRILDVVSDNVSVAYPDVSPMFRTLLSLNQRKMVLQKYTLQAGYIYHGGGLEIRKNTAHVLHTYAKLVSETTNVDIPPLVISGNIFSVKNALATDVVGLIRTLGIEHRVHLLGFVPAEDLPALYQSALFFVYPSLYEGFGLPVLEALNSGVPVITSNASALPEVGGDAVVYVDAENREMLVEQMKRLIGDTALRAELMRQGLVQAQKFNWQYFTLHILKTLIR
ncbi:MAG: glycosyltransferase family 4 protein [Minisyncoccota bacterium]